MRLTLSLLPTMHSALSSGSPSAESAVGSSGEVEGSLADSGGVCSALSECTAAPHTQSHERSLGSLDEGSAPLSIVCKRHSTAQLCTCMYVVVLGSITTHVL